MPIDARIPLTGDRPVEFNAVQSLGDMMKLKVGVDAVRDYDDARADQTEVKRIVQAGQGNVGVIAKSLRERGFHKDADEYEKRDAVQKTQKLTELEQTIKAQRDMLDFGGQLIQGVIMAPKETQGDLWAVSKQKMASMGPEMAQMAETIFGETYDPMTTPAKLKYFENIGLTAQESNRRQMLALTSFQKGEPQKAMSQMLSAVPAHIPREQGQKLWNDIFAAAKDLGIDENILRMFPQQFTPDNVKAAFDMGMTTNERKDNANADERAATDRIRADAYARNSRSGGAGTGGAANERAREQRLFDAKKWRADKLAALTGNNDLSPAAIAAAKAEIETAYKSMVEGLETPPATHPRVESTDPRTVGDLMGGQLPSYNAAPRAAQSPLFGGGVSAATPLTGSDVAQTGAVSGGSPSSPSSQAPPREQSSQATPPMGTTQDRTSPSRDGSLPKPLKIGEPKDQDAIRQRVSEWLKAHGKQVTDKNIQTFLTHENPEYQEARKQLNIAGK